MDVFKTSKLMPLPLSPGSSLTCPVGRNYHSPVSDIVSKASLLLYNISKVTAFFLEKEGNKCCALVGGRRR